MTEPTLSTLQTLIENTARLQREDAQAREGRTIKAMAVLETELRGEVRAVVKGLSTVNADVAQLRAKISVADVADRNARKALESHDELEGRVIIALGEQDKEIAEVKGAVVGKESPLAKLVKESVERGAQMRMLLWLVPGVPIVLGGFYFLITHLK